MSDQTTPPPNPTTPQTTGASHPTPNITATPPPGAGPSQSGGALPPNTTSAPKFSFEQVLGDCGFPELKENPDPDDLREVLCKLRDAASKVHGPDRTLMREGAVRLLKQKGVTSPARVVDEFMPVIDGATLDHADTPINLPRECDEILAEYDKDELHRADLLLRQEMLDVVPAAVAKLGHVGEPQNTQTLWLIMLSSVWKKPLGSEVVATSAAGKSNFVDCVSALFPDAIVIRITSSSPKALYYMACLEHRIVCVAERDLAAESEFGCLALRELMSRGYLRRDVVDTDPRTGERKTVAYVVKGPISYNETTTANQRQDEDASRMVRITSDESRNQTRRVQHAIAEDFKGTSRKTRGKWERWRRGFQAAYALLRQEVLGDDPLYVLVPYADLIVEHFPDEQVRTRRLLPQALILLSTVALARLRHHKVHRDADGRRYVEADREDWRRASPILRHLVRRALANIDEQSVETLKTIQANVAEGAPFTVTEAKKWQGLSESTVRRRLQPLLDAGLVEADYTYVLGGRGKTVKYKVTGRREPERMDCDLPEDLWNVPSVAAPAPAAPTPNGPIPPPTLPPPAVLPSDRSEDDPLDWLDPDTVSPSSSEGFAEGEPYPEPPPPDADAGIVV